MLIVHLWIAVQLARHENLGPEYGGARVAHDANIQLALRRGAPEWLVRLCH